MKYSHESRKKIAFLLDKNFIINHDNNDEIFDNYRKIITSLPDKDFAKLFFDKRIKNSNLYILSKRDIFFGNFQIGTEKYLEYWWSAMSKLDLSKDEDLEKLLLFGTIKHNDSVRYIGNIHNRIINFLCFNEDIEKQKLTTIYFYKIFYESCCHRFNKVWKDVVFELSSKLDKFIILEEICRDVIVSNLDGNDEYSGDRRFWFVVFLYENSKIWKNTEWLDKMMKIYQELVPKIFE